MGDRRTQGWGGWLPSGEPLHAHRAVDDLIPSMRVRPGFTLMVIRCITCQHHWVRCVRTSIVPGELGAWLCPAGWGNGCPGAYFITVDRPAVEAAWLLTGCYGFGDTEGMP